MKNELELELEELLLEHELELELEEHELEEQLLDEQDDELLLDDELEHVTDTEYVNDGVCIKSEYAYACTAPYRFSKSV